MHCGPEQKKHRINKHLIINRPVLLSVLLVDLAHSAMVLVFLSGHNRQFFIIKLLSKSFIPCLLIHLLG